MEEDIKELVLQFHNTYEELAPEFGYETRKDTREFDFNSNNGKLMYATIEKLVKPILNRLEQDERVIEEMAESILWESCGSHTIEEVINVYRKKCE